jgi:hypothetical protein
VFKRYAAASDLNCVLAVQSGILHIYPNFLLLGKSFETRYTFNSLPVPCTTEFKSMQSTSSLSKRGIEFRHTVHLAAACSGRDSAR